MHFSRNIQLDFRTDLASVQLPQPELRFCRGTHKFRRLGGQHRQRGVLVGKPGRYLPLRNHQRHPVMHRLHGAVGGGGENAVAILAAAPVKEASHIEDICTWDCELIFPLVGVPFIESCCRDQAPLSTQALPEQGLFLGRLRSCVDHQRAGQLIPPFHQNWRGTRSLPHQDRRLGRGADLPRRPLPRSVLPLDRIYNLTNFFTLLCCKLITPTHSLWPPVQQVVRSNTKYSIPQFCMGVPHQNSKGKNAA